MGMQASDLWYEIHGQGYSNDIKKSLSHKEENS